MNLENCYCPPRTRWWRDGLVWSCIGLTAMGGLVGFAIGTVVWG